MHICERKAIQDSQLPANEGVWVGTAFVFKLENYQHRTSVWSGCERKKDMVARHKTGVRGVFSFWN